MLYEHPNFWDPLRMPWRVPSRSGQRRTSPSRTRTIRMTSVPPRRFTNKQFYVWQPNIFVLQWLGQQWQNTGIVSFVLNVIMFCICMYDSLTILITTSILCIYIHLYTRISYFLFFFVHIHICNAMLRTHIITFCVDLGNVQNIASCSKVARPSIGQPGDLHPAWISGKMSSTIPPNNGIVGLSQSQGEQHVRPVIDSFCLKIWPLAHSRSERPLLAALNVTVRRIHNAVWGHEKEFLFGQCQSLSGSRR